MIWSLYAELGVQMWRRTVEELEFDDEAWERIVSEAHKAGLNMIVLDVAEGVEWKSHPELSVKGAWSYYRVKKGSRETQSSRYRTYSQAEFFRNTRPVARRIQKAYVHQGILRRLP